MKRMDCLEKKVDKAVELVNSFDARINDLDDRVRILEGGESDVKVERIDLALTSDTIYAGSTVKAETNVAATVFPSNASNKDLLWRTSDSDIAVVDETGFVRALSEGDVEIICESTDGSGVRSTITVHVLDKAVVNTNYEYSTPVVKLTYPNIAQVGGVVSPNLTYEQDKKATYTYNDGTTSEEDMPKITTGGDVVYTKKSGVATMSEDGKVSYTTENTSLSDEERATIEVSVTLNGETGKTEAKVKQTKYTLYWYLGQITKSRSEFGAMTASELKAACSAVSTSTKSKDITINKSVWFAMVPAGTTVNSAQYAAGGMTSTFTASEIEDPSVFNATHEDVEIDGKTYHVYGYRHPDFVGSNAAGKFVIN